MSVWRVRGHEKPFHHPLRKPPRMFNGRLFPQNLRYKCGDCGAEFLNTAGAKKFEAHLLRFRHMGGQMVPNWGYDRRLIQRYNRDFDFDAWDRLLKQVRAEQEERDNIEIAYRMVAFSNNMERLPT